MASIEFDAKVLFLINCQAEKFIQALLKCIKYPSYNCLRICSILYN